MNTKKKETISVNCKHLKFQPQNWVLYFNQEKKESAKNGEARNNRENLPSFPVFD